jgi:hypothetical protein
VVAVVPILARAHGRSSDVVRVHPERGHVLGHHARVHVHCREAGLVRSLAPGQAAKVLHERGKQAVGLVVAAAQALDGAVRGEVEVARLEEEKLGARVSMRTACRSAISRPLT